MSKIFQALQRSVSERTGSSFAEVSSVATELLQETVGRSCVEQCASLAPTPLPESRAVAINDPAAMGSEKFRVLAVRLRHLRLRRELKRILVTSALPEEGKSVVSLNLASTFARFKEARVLLVEGDMRKPTIRTELGLPAIKGLSEWLRTDLPLQEVIHRITPPGFWLLPAGEPLSNPLELMQSGRLAVLLDQVAESFDWIIIDSTPVLPVADTSVWARLSHGILMVVREGKTEKRQLQKALEATDKSALVGVVLNSASNGEHKSYYKYYAASHEK
jgi:capsular exopolysaccharide synthesis family protein